MGIFRRLVKDFEQEKEAMNKELEDYKIVLKDILQYSRTSLNQYKAHIDNGFSQAASAKNQAEYSDLLSKYSAQKDIFGKYENHITKIEHMIENNQFADIANEVKQANISSGGGNSANYQRKR